MESAQRLIDFQQVVAARRLCERSRDPWQVAASAGWPTSRSDCPRKYGRSASAGRSRSASRKAATAAASRPRWASSRPTIIAARAVGAGALHPLAIVPDQLVEPSALDVQAVHAVEHRPAPRVLFERRQELCDQAPFRFVVGRRGRGAGWSDPAACSNGPDAINSTRTNSTQDERAWCRPSRRDRHRSIFRVLCCPRSFPPAARCRRPGAGSARSSGEWIPGG